jgi:hypothetical protein
MCESNAYYERYLKGSYCIGVHVRFAAAHSAEMPGGRVAVQDYIAGVREVIQSRQKSGSEKIKIFLAADSNYVIQEFQKNFLEDQLYFIKAVRSAYDADPHLIFEDSDYWLSHPAEFHAKKPGFFGGKAVLLDCLLLSKCNTFVHSVSNVSSFVSFFNPYIDSIFLPKGLSPRPCKLKLHAVP